MKHPLEFLPETLRKPFFYFLLALTLAMFAIFNRLDQPLRTSAAPNGIVSFELAYDPALSRRMADSWDADAKLAAAFGLGFDYLFMPAYALTLSLGLLLARGANPSRCFFLANLTGWGVFAAALFDAVENFCLWKILAEGAASPYSQIAALCAAVKFALLILALLAAVFCAFFNRARRA